MWKTTRMTVPSVPDDCEVQMSSGYCGPEFTEEI